MNEEKIKSTLDLERFRQAILAKRDPQKSRIAICAGTGCLALGARKVITTFKEELKKRVGERCGDPGDRLSVIL